ncbi:MAG TPA: hypothetical protein VHP58_06225 [Alphaproteobacteria bacterium]|nr:hypothetical protein [Alphaproteobacteria bacterium]
MQRSFIVTATFVLMALLAALSFPALAQQADAVAARLADMNTKREQCFKAASAVVPKAMKASYAKCAEDDRKLQQQFKADMRAAQTQQKQSRAARKPAPEAANLPRVSAP